MFSIHWFKMDGAREVLDLVANMGARTRAEAISKALALWDTRALDRGITRIELHENGALEAFWRHP